MLKTIEEIKDDVLEKWCGDKDDADYMFNHLWDETCKLLREYNEDDEFYTNGNVYYPKEYAEAEMYEHAKALAYIDDRDLKANFQEYCDTEFLDFLWLGYDYPHNKFKEVVKDFVFEDYNDYMEWIMGD